MSFGNRGQTGCFLIVCCYGATGTYRSREYSPPRHATRQRPPIPTHLRLRAHRLPRIVAEVRAAARIVAARLLPDVQPRALGGDPAEGRGPGDGPEADSRTLRVLLERSPQVHRPCVARTILFLSVRRLASVGGVALHGIEPGAGAAGNARRLMALVERGRALRRAGAASVLGHGDMGQALVGRHMARVPVLRRKGGWPRLRRRTLGAPAFRLLEGWGF